MNDERPTTTELHDAAVELDVLWDNLKQREQETSLARSNECAARNNYNDHKKRFDDLNARFLKGRDKT